MIIVICRKCINALTIRDYMFRMLQDRHYHSNRVFFLALQIGLIASNDLELHQNGYLIKKNTSHIVFQRMCHCMHICISILRNLDVD